MNAAVFFSSSFNSKIEGFFLIRNPEIVLFTFNFFLFSRFNIWFIGNLFTTQKIACIKNAKMQSVID